MDHNKDGGYKSRKMVMSYIAMGLMLIAYLITVKWPSLGALYSEFCMAILAASGIYVGGNTAVKWMAAKSQYHAQPAKTDNKKKEKTEEDSEE